MSDDYTHGDNALDDSETLVDSWIALRDKCLEQQERITELEAALREIAQGNILDSDCWEIASNALKGGE